MKRFRTEIELPAAAEDVYALVIDPAFLEDKARQMGCLAVRVSSRQEDGETVIEQVEERAPVMGKERSKGTLTTRWNAASRLGRWRHVQHGQEERSRSEGTVALVARGSDRSALVTEGSVSIDVPLLGGMIEKKVVKALEKERLLDRAFYVSRLASSR